MGPLQTGTFNRLKTVTAVNTTDTVAIVQSGNLVKTTVANLVAGDLGVTTTGTQTLTNKSLSDTTTAIIGAADATKKIKFTATGNTTGITTTIASASTSARTITLPDATDTLVGKATTDTLTNKTLTSPVLTAPTLGVATATSLNGLTVTTSTGTLTVPNSVVLTGPASSGTAATLANAETLTNKTLTDPIITNVTRCSGSVTANGTITYANVTGLVQTVAIGTYKFRCVLPSTVASGTGGIKYAFNYTTAVLSALEATGVGFTASAVAVQHTTTTTTQTDLFTQAAVVIMTMIEGTMVVSTGGTVQLQMAQNTSNGSNSITLLGASMEFARIA